MAENTPYAPKLFRPICLPKPKSLGFSKKSYLWMSVVRDKHKEAFSTLVESLVQMTFIDFTNFLKSAEFTI